MRLTSTNAKNIYGDCMTGRSFGSSIVGVAPIEADRDFIHLDKAKLIQHRTEIDSMLRQLPECFRQSKGGGWTFLNLCTDKGGVLWTGLHERAAQLLYLGIGIGKMDYLLPREMWKALPGGMPYVVYKD